MRTGEIVFTRRRRTELFPRRTEAGITAGEQCLASVRLGLCHRRMCRAAGITPGCGKQIIFFRGRGVEVASCIGDGIRLI